MDVQHKKKVLESYKGSEGPLQPYYLNPGAPIISATGVLKFCVLIKIALLLGYPNRF